MKKIKLHQWLSLVLFMAVLTSCSKKSYPSENAADVEEQQYESSKNASADDYTPPQVITIPDERARSNKEGELYYDNEYGYRYWRYCDGKYYLDAKYENAKAAGKKLSRKKHKQQHPGMASSDKPAAPSSE